MGVETDAGAAHAVLSVANGVMTVRINRPDTYNAISPQVTAALWAAVEQTAEREDVGALVIASSGRYFTSGIDLGAVPADRSQGGLSSDQDYRRAYRRHHLLYDEMEALEKPVVIAIQGICLGAGVEMAVSCDFRLASKASQFELPEINLAVLPGSGGTSRLTRLVGPHWAKWMVMAGRRVDAQRALMMGLVHEVYSVETFDVEVQRFAEDLAAKHREAVGLAKLVIDMAADLDRTNQRHLERIANASLDGKEEFLRLTARFREPKNSAGGV